MTQAIDAVSEFIATEIMHDSSDTKIDPDLGLLEEGIIDSLGLQQIITFIEQQFKITIDDDDLMPLLLKYADGQLLIDQIVLGQQDAQGSHFRLRIGGRRSSSILATLVQSGNDCAVKFRLLGWLH